MGPWTGLVQVRARLDYFKKRGEVLTFWLWVIWCLDSGEFKKGIFCVKMISGRSFPILVFKLEVSELELANV